ncbi:MAG: hypothetical protein EOO71_41105 [Myxococcaceae bacterium]|nr:MAG: hypothetical protein EOO71_41105 [Myxococcaceae bacterium]
MNDKVTSAALSTAFKSSQSLSSAESSYLGMLKGPDRDRAEAQLMLQKQQEAVAFASNVIKKLHEIAMSVINNMK